MKKQYFDKAILYYATGSKAQGLLIDPRDQWETVKVFLKENKITLKYLMVTVPNLENTYDLSTVRIETGAKFLSFKTDLLQLRNLPREADLVNVCGVKIPHVDRFLDGLEKVDLEGMIVHIGPSQNGHAYTIDDVEITYES